jgi:hypothetical protein
MSVVAPIAAKMVQRRECSEVPFASFAAKQKAESLFAVFNEPPYVTRCWERAPSTTSQADIARLV